MNDFPTGDPHCPDCGGQGYYQGIGAKEPCRTCSKKEGDPATIEDALEFGDLVEELFPGAQEDDSDSIQATMDAAPGLSGPEWNDSNDGSEWKRGIDGPHPNKR